MKRTGFSLIELMVVIAIVGILAAVSIPVYRNYQIRAEISKAMNAVTFFQNKIIEYYNKNSDMPNATNLGVYDGVSGTQVVDSSYYASGGTYVNYIEITRRANGGSLCTSATGCTDLIIGWNSSLGIGAANTMWIRFWEENGIIKTHCGLWNIVPQQYRSLYPSNCQGVAAAFSSFAV